MYKLIIVFIINYFLLSFQVVYGEYVEYDKKNTVQKNSLVRVIENSINTKIYNKYGFYSKDKVRVLWLNDGRKARLLETLIFTDPYGKKWVAPKDHVIDGASIPIYFRPVIGTPYGGKYVMASIIHDVACDEKKVSWKEVHKAFYHAMLASGVSSKKASLMYNAVYEGGPRWGVDAEKRLSERELKELIASMRYKNLALDFKESDFHNFDAAGELRLYDGLIIYSGENWGMKKITIGGIKKVNDFSLSVYSNIKNENIETYAGVKYKSSRLKYISLEAIAGKGKPKIGFTYDKPAVISIQDSKAETARLIRESQ